MTVLKRGPMLKMMEAMAAGDRRVKWSHVLQHIDAAVVADHQLDNVKLPFESPLPAFCVPTDELRAELAYDRKTGDSVLRKAVLAGAPVRVVAALCHLSPEALAAVDHKGRVVLHLACLLPPTSEHTQLLLTLLVKAHAAALLARDQGGRTPLHYLCWFHAKQRTPEIVATFCTRLPKTKFYGLKQNTDASLAGGDNKKHPLPEIPRPQARSIPNSAAIIPDAQHGCIPLHYAVANQCSADVLTVLLQVFPLSKHVTDRYGRTALHWYLGAGHVPTTTSNTINDDEGDNNNKSRVRHVSGEEPNPHEAPWWQRPIQPAVLELLLSSRVARTTDWQGRYVLHWAARKAALALYHHVDNSSSCCEKSDSDNTTPTTNYDDDPSSSSAAYQFLATDMKTIRSHFTGQIVGQDAQDQTPVMVFFDTIQKCQETHGMRMVHPNMEILRLLMQHPDNISEKHIPAAVEDASGRLPLHAAVEIGASEDVVALLVQQHPTALVHTSETYQAPLHAAFTARAAPLQTTDVLQVLLQTYTAGSHETVVVDGRMALKLEDAAGSFPIHYAAENQAILAVLQLLVRSYPPISLQQRSDGNLAVHCLMRPSMIQFLTTPANISTATPESPVHTEQDFLDARQKLQVFFPYLLECEDKLAVKGSVSQILPLHMAVLFQVVDRFSLLRILRAYPEAAQNFTSVPEYSVLDMHELVQPRWLSSEVEWHFVRELLFAYVPNLASHRHRQELLDRCVRIVIDETNQVGQRPHWQATKELDKQEKAQPSLQLSHSLSAVEAKTRMNLKIRSPPKKSRKKKANKSEKTVKNTTPRSRLPSPRKNALLALSMSKESKDTNHVLSSVYDEDGTNLDYGITSGSFSEGETDDDEDESYFSNEEDDDGPTDGDEDGEEGDYTDEDEEGEEIVLGDSTYSEDEGFRTESNSMLTGQSLESDSYTNSLSYQQSASFGDSTNASQAFGFSHSLGASASMDSRIQPQLKRTSQGLIMPLPASLDAFDRARIAMKDKDEEEKKSDKEGDDAAKPGNQKVSRIVKATQGDRPVFLSDVGMRLWTFFAMFSDDNNPSDNYVDQISSIFDEIPFARVETLTRLLLPSFASLYLRNGDDGMLSNGSVATFRDIANPKCRELIHKTCYFVGKYDFSTTPGKDLLVHRHPSGRSFVVRGFEWQFTTQELTDAINPGMSEATIWKTGEIPAEVGLTFRSNKRPVFVKFTQDGVEYEDEISSRRVLGESCVVLPLLSDYSAESQDTKNNRTYRTDINDVRFNRLDLGHGNVVCLENFPYALVYAESIPLVDLYRQRGFDSDLEKKTVCKDIGEALVELHSKNIVHGGLSLNKIVRLNDENAPERWLLSDCVGSTISGSDSTGALGKVSQMGNLLTTPMSAPPELMEKATPAQLRHYGRYWSEVKKKWGVDVGKEISEPYVNPTSGESFLFRYYYDVPVGDKAALPQLPYRTLAANTAADIWAFGLIIFEIYSGRPLIPYDERSGAILDCSLLAKWDDKEVTALIYNSVIDPLAQDLLFLLLGSEQIRLGISMKDVMKHPLFLPMGSSTAEMKSIIEKRRMDTAAHKRLLQRRLEQSSVKEWRDSRSISLVCWDTSVLEKFLLTPTDIVDRLTPAKTEISFPCTHVFLPYRLVRNEYGVLSPEKPDDFVKVETLGANVLFLSKACRYACLVQEAMQLRPLPKKWTSSDFLSLVSEAYYDDVKKDLNSLASKYVESFRDDPMSIVLKLVQDRIIDVLSLYADDDAEYYLYLVDEFRCLPHVESPIVMTAQDDRRSEVILCSLLSMQMTVLYSIHKYSGSQGLLQLLNESATGHIPPSWMDALPMRLRRNLHPQESLEEIVQELHVLQGAFSSLEASHQRSGVSQRHLLHPDGDLRVLRHLVEDRVTNWGDLYRITVPDGLNAECCLWTHIEVAEGLRQRASQSTWKYWMAHQRRMGTPPQSPHARASTSRSRSPRSRSSASSSKSSI